MAFKQIKTPKVADMVVEQVQALILRGVLKPNEKLPPERELAQLLEVSRPSLREALQRLETLGLVYSRQGGGTYVRSVVTEAFTEPLVHLMRSDPDTALDYIEFRHDLEGAAAYHAALRATETDRQILTAHMTAMEEAHGIEDPTREADVDADFHLAVAEAAHNTVLLHIAQGLYKLLREGVFYNRARLYNRKGARALLLAQHRAVYGGIMEQDPEAARAASEAHMSYVKQTLREMGKEKEREELARRRMSLFRSRIEAAEEPPTVAEGVPEEDEEG